MKKFLALGCSHTAGTGLNIGDVYVDKVASCMRMEVENRAIPSGNASECLKQLCSMLMNNTEYEFVVIQWPNFFRRTFYHKSKKIYENVNNATPNFFDTFKSSEKNFTEPWFDSVITANLLCNKCGIDILNIYLDTFDDQTRLRLSDLNIKIHEDEKIEGRTWFFDNAASDGMHHSAGCHTKWADRIVRILNENTA